jgi:hypothetical protein
MQPIETYQSSSSVIEFINRMDLVDKASHSLEVGFSIKLAKEDFESWEQLEAFANDASRGKRRYVVVEHDDCYEMGRLPDGHNRKLYYELNARPVACVTPQCGHPDDAERAIAEVKRIVVQYKAASYEQITKYRSASEKMKAENVVAKSYLHRRLASTTLFYNNGKRLQDAINALCRSGLLTEVPKQIAKGIYDSTALMYRINEVKNEP